MLLSCSCAPHPLTTPPSPHTLPPLHSKYELAELVCLGGFNNTRQEVSWQGFTLELDETKYPWGTLYELEAETVSSAVCSAVTCPNRVQGRERGRNQHAD